jgi:hypothetical protein
VQHREGLPVDYGRPNIAAVGKLRVRAAAVQRDHPGELTAIHAAADLGRSDDRRKGALRAIDLDGEDAGTDRYPSHEVLARGQVKAGLIVYLYCRASEVEVDPAAGVNPDLIQRVRLECGHGRGVRPFGRHGGSPVADL